MGKISFGHVFAFQIACDGRKEDISPNILQEDNVWQKIWDKVRFYWEHIVKHIDNLGNTLRTHWEHDGNATKKHIGNNKNLKNLSLSLSLSLSPKIKREKNLVYWAHAAIPHWLTRNFYLEYQLFWHGQMARA